MSKAMTLAIDVEALVREVTRDVVEKLRAREQRAPAPELLACCGEAERLKAEMVRVGRKLWEREYVDGNGGNLSVRLTRDYVLCTPTMLSKGDLVPADICLCDMDGKIAAGGHARSSELILHLEIYKANPKARAVVHCHPPHATAFAVTGSTPPVGVLTEQEIFVGPVAMAPYETPGTRAFAETVVPFVARHNTIMLKNHGIVCWADTLTHAEWLTEIFDTYCRTILLARQTGLPLSRIPEEKIQEILDLKQRLGFPDARLEEVVCPDEEFRDFEPRFDRAEIEELVREAVGRHSY
jgi:L-fuculose-phosphate aldolase